jgi:hydrogenase maturation protein HypF
LERLRISLFGAVQGVGFRPFVYRLAEELGLAGWISNDSNGVTIEVEGAASALEAFERRLENERPEASVVLARERSRLAPAGYSGFAIRESGSGATRTAALLPDLATCRHCLSEITDPTARRYRYPFTNCTLCGPRFTIITDLPYDRERTTMRDFALCPECNREYRDPSDRRFHAQPIACPSCGPKIDLPVEEAAAAIRDGRIVAVKGIGGYLLLCDALNGSAVRRLRERKRREGKPLAVMMPSLDAARRYCRIRAEEEQVLLSAAAPIVLLAPGEEPLAPEVSSESPFVGAMLPYSPLHHLLMEAVGSPVVATSGNLSGEPIAIEETEARERLSKVADLFLSHNRPIARPCDDSVVRVSGTVTTVLRRARGIAPLPVPAFAMGEALPRILAVGGHLKNTVAIAVGQQVILSQHIGDLDTPEARRAFEKAIADLCRLYDFKPEAIACDLHPDYASTRWARASGRRVIAVQHHMAHAAACAAENDLTERHLAVAWDGTGFGLDGTVWGGELFLVESSGAMTRTGHLRPFLLPGGEAAVREGWRVAQAMLAEAGIEQGGFAHRLIARMIERRVNCPAATSVGRLFDAIAALAGIARESRFEGQAAMLVERAADPTAEGVYPLPVAGGVADWEPLLRAVLADTRAGAPPGGVAMRFHRALAAWVAQAAFASGVQTVSLSGGVFQNGLLTELVREQLQELGVRVAVHQRVPPNDGGLAFGQAILAAREIRALG